MLVDFQELTLRQEAGDAAGEARAHSHLGAVHMALGHYSHAARCYRVSLFSMTKFIHFSNRFRIKIKYSSRSS